MNKKFVLSFWSYSSGNYLWQKICGADQQVWKEMTGIWGFFQLNHSNIFASKILWGQARIRPSWGISFLDKNPMSILLIPCCMQTKQRTLLGPPSHVTKQHVASLFSVPPCLSCVPSSSSAIVEWVNKLTLLFLFKSLYPYLDWLQASSSQEFGTFWLDLTGHLEGSSELKKFVFGGCSHN